MPVLQNRNSPAQLHAGHAPRIHPKQAYIYYSARVKRLSVRANCERSLSPVHRSGRPSWPDGRFIASVNQPALAFAGVTELRNYQGDHGDHRRSRQEKEPIHQEVRARIIDWPSHQPATFRGLLDPLLLLAQTRRPFLLPRHYGSLCRGP